MKATATQIKTHFGHYLDLAGQGEPVIVERSGAPTAAIIDYEEYQHLKKLDDVLLMEKIRIAESHGYLSTEDSDVFFKSLLGRLADDITAEGE